MREGECVSGICEGEEKTSYEEWRRGRSVEVVVVLVGWKELKSHGR